MFFLRLTYTFIEIIVKNTLYTVLHWYTLIVQRMHAKLYIFTPQYVVWATTIVRWRRHFITFVVHRNRFLFHSYDLSKV